MRWYRTAGPAVTGEGRRRPPAFSRFGKMISSADILPVVPMAATLDDDVRSLSAWMRVAWRRLADPSLTSFDRRETRNCMNEAEIALRAGLKRIAGREKTRREAEKAALVGRRPDFRILKLDT
jgi:hypothetical protein